MVRKEFNGQVIDIVCHLDESTPHWHINIIPTEFDEKKKKWKLNARDLTARNNMQRWQSDFNKMFEDFDFQYKKNSKAKHNDVKKYYEMTNKTIDENQLIRELAEKEKEILNNKYKELFQIEKARISEELELKKKKVNHLMEEIIIKDEEISILKDQVLKLMNKVNKLIEQGKEFIKDIYFLKTFKNKLEQLEERKRRRNENRVRNPNPDGPHQFR